MHDEVCSHLDIKRALIELGLRFSVRLAQGRQLSGLPGGLPFPGSQLPVQRTRVALRCPVLRRKRLYNSFREPPKCGGANTEGP